ncbi:hypothetical protein Tco_0449540 [Tanacetum coccineum]
MEQMTSICDMVGQIMQKKEEEKRITEEQATKDQYWKIPICYDNDEDYAIATTPVSSTNEPVDSLIMEDEHLDTILEMKKTSVEDLVHIPSEFEGISEDTCDVLVCGDSSTFDALSDHSEILSDSNNDGTSSDDDSYENIEYVEALPLNLEIVSLEEVNKDQEEKDHLITNIESLKDNPTPDRMLKSPSSFPIPVADSDSFFEESDTYFSHLDNSLPEFETFSDHTEETRSGCTTTHANNSLPEYDLFLLKIEPDQGGLISIVISDNSNDPLLELPEFESFHFDLYDDPSFPRPPLEPPDVEISLIIETDAPVINDFDELNLDECFDPGETFLPFLIYPVDSPFLYSFGNEDTIFDPGPHIFTLEPWHSHRAELNEIQCLIFQTTWNESPIGDILFHSFPMDNCNSGSESSLLLGFAWMFETLRVHWFCPFNIRASYP